MKIIQLREQLSDLKKKEVIAQTREQLLREEREKLLQEIAELYVRVRPLEIFPESELTPGNLSNIITKLQTIIDSELAKSKIPLELL